MNASLASEDGERLLLPGKILVHRPGVQDSRAGSNNSLADGPAEVCYTGAGYRTLRSANTSFQERL